MNVPNDLMYSKTHEWVKTLEDGKVAVGITDFAQDSMGDIVFINLPQTGDGVNAGKAFCDIESVKAVSDVNSPVAGIICDVNEALTNSPEKLNEEPYESWIIKVENVTATDLMTAEQYEEFCLKEA